MKSDGKRMQKREEELEKPTKYNAAAMNNGDDCIDVNLMFDTNTKMGNMEKLSTQQNRSRMTQRQQEKRKSKSLPPSYFKKVSAITVQEWRCARH